MEKVNKSNFYDIINYEDLTVVDFFANWCSPCRMLKPIFERVEPNFPDCKFCTVDVDESEDIAKEFRIFSVPTIVCFRNGGIVGTMVGLNSYDDIYNFVKECLDVK